MAAKVSLKPPGAAAAQNQAYANKAKAGVAQQSLTGLAIDGILSALNAQPTWVEGSAGSAGTPGYTVSRQADRDAANSAVQRAIQGRQQVTDQSVAAVKAREGDIRKGYTDMTASLRADASTRGAQAAAANTKRDTEALNAAAAMGLPAAPVVDGTGADAVSASYQKQVGTNAESWAGFNGGAEQRAVERNNAVGDAFVWEGSQQRAALDSMLMSALQQLADYYVPGSGGSGGSAGYFDDSGVLTKSQRMSAYNSLVGIDDKENDNDLAYAKYLTAQKPKTTMKYGPSGKLLGYSQSGS